MAFIWSLGSVSIFTNVILYKLSCFLAANY